MRHSSVWICVDDIILLLVLCCSIVIRKKNSSNAKKAEAKKKKKKKNKFKIKKNFSDAKDFVYDNKRYLKPR